ncbi:hypothetical protein DFH11DRAFT_1758901 [Phellopilus nigrolimitatus]|nr:hypothetical protein DFH11DRAFT_1758901 [Phellopilus nigrolimitatus]
MDSSALPSEAHIKGLEYHALRTLARVHGLKATGPREQIRERLLKWRAEIVPEHNPVYHSADNEGAAPCSASGSGTATKENSGAAPKRSTARKRKAEEIDSETGAATSNTADILAGDAAAVIANTFSAISAAVSLHAAAPTTDMGHHVLHSGSRWMSGNCQARF